MTFMRTCAQHSIAPATKLLLQTTQLRGPLGTRASQWESCPCIGAHSKKSDSQSHGVRFLIGMLSVSISLFIIKQDFGQILRNCCAIWWEEDNLYRKYDKKKPNIYDLIKKCIKYIRYIEDIDFIYIYIYTYIYIHCTHKKHTSCKM